MMQRASRALGLSLLVLSLAFGLASGALQSGGSRFQYGSVSRTPDIFEVKVPIALRYIGENAWVLPAVTPSTSVVWSVTDSAGDATLAGCEFTAVSGVDASLLCTVAGVKRVQVVRIDLGNATDTLMLTVRDREGCYNWYVIPGLPSQLDVVPATPPITVEHHSTQPYSIRIWATDQASSSAAERAITAGTPAMASQVLTKALFNLGEWPMVSLNNATALRWVQTNQTRLGLQYNASAAYWYGQFYTLDAQQLDLEVSGKA